MLTYIYIILFKKMQLSCGLSYSQPAHSARDRAKNFKKPTNHKSREMDQRKRELAALPEV